MRPGIVTAVILSCALGAAVCLEGRATEERSKRAAPRQIGFEERLPTATGPLGGPPTVRRGASRRGTALPAVPPLLDATGPLIVGKDLAAASLGRQDLSGKKLAFADLRAARLAFARLRGADLTGAQLTGADLRGTDLRAADLRGATLYQVVLSGADLARANLKGAIYNRATKWPFGFDPRKRGAILIE